MRASNPSFATLLESIDEYRKKYYQNQLFKGTLVAVALLLTLFLFINTVEYFGKFNSIIRGMLLFGYVVVVAFSVYRWILTPLFHLTGLAKPLSNEEAARQIGKFFPSVNDKLLNTLQLGALSDQKSDLIEASIRQRAGELLVVRFSEAINFKENSKYLKYAAYPIAALAMVLLFNPSLVTTSSERILKFNTAFNYAPFVFILENDQLKGFRNEDFTVKLKLEGSSIPDQVFLVSNGTRFKLNDDGNGVLSYTFKSLQKEIPFHFEAAGYKSENYKIILRERPGLLSFDVLLDYPKYLGKPAETLTNVGNLTLPEGTRVTWRFKTMATNGLAVRFDGDSNFTTATERKNHIFEFARTLRKTAGYDIKLSNDDLPEGQKVNYMANVIPDRYPELAMENFQDTTLYNYLVIGGSISDDYGFTRLSLFYNVIRKGEENSAKESPKSIPIPANLQVNNQSYYFQWYLDSLNLRPGDRLEYFTQVWDNDGVNGPKSTRSRSLVFSVPDKQQITTEITKSMEETQKEIENAVQKARELERDLQELENKLKANNELDFQERKMAEEILRKREELLQQIQTLQEKNRISNEKSRQFDRQSESIQEKMDELQQLMNELLQEDSQKLYQELEKLLDQKQSERMSKLLERLRNKERNTEKELERTLNLFKKLQMEQKLESVIEDLHELADEQEELAEKTEMSDDRKENDSQSGSEEKQSSEDKNQSNPNDSQQELLQEQERIEEDFNEILERLEEIEKLGEEIDQKPDTQKGEQEEIKNAQQQSKQQLRKNQNEQAAESQKKSSKSMRKMAQQMEAEMQRSQTMQMQEDMDSLRDILENLHTLSFDQEQLMKDFKGVNLSDPRFVQLAQKQIKLQDDSKVIEDSLYALANRVLEIQSFITRELNNMKYYMDESARNIKDRKLPMVAPNQQFAMTSANNLALMLSDVFQRMQEALAMAMMMPGKGDKSESGNSPGEMQQQLNQQMREMGEGREEGKGQRMSEQLARMAAQQAAIREMVRKLLESQKGNEFSEQYGQQLQEIMEQMEQSETEIVNKRISRELIQRNEEMVTRLLESEKALREQDEDEQRKGETARQLQRQPPPAFEEYIQHKLQQTELLRTVPPNFTPFYKRAADSYFQNPVSTQ